MQFGNYITTAAFAHRLLELPDMASERNAELRGKVRKDMFMMENWSNFCGCLLAFYMLYIYNPK